MSDVMTCFVWVQSSDNTPSYMVFSLQYTPTDMPAICGMEKLQ